LVAHKRMLMARQRQDLSAILPSRLTLQKQVYIPTTQFKDDDVLA